jgi:hypothetical protein
LPAALLTALLLDCRASQTLRPVDKWVASWTGDIWGLPNGVLPSGPVIGNGDLGMTLQTNNHTGCFELWLGLNSMWGVPSTIENPTNNTLGAGNTFKPQAPYPSQTALGGLTLCVRDQAFIQRANFTAMQRFADGVIIAQYSLAGSNCSVSTTSFLHPVDKVLVTEVDFNGFATNAPRPNLTLESWTTTLWRNATPAAAAESTRAGWDPLAAAQYFSRVSIPGNTVARRSHQLQVAVGTKVLGALSTGPTVLHNATAAANAGIPAAAVAIGVRSTIVSSPQTAKIAMITVAKSTLDLPQNPNGNADVNADGMPVQIDYFRDPLPYLLRELSDTTCTNASSANAIARANEAYWEHYWQRASVSLPSHPLIERTWFVGNYMLSSASRPAVSSAFGGSNFPNLWGPWSTEGFKGAQECGWCSAFVSDYNAEALQYGAFSSNKLEQLQSYVDLVTAFLPEARRGAINTARVASSFPGRNASLLQCMLDAPNAVHFPCGLGPFGKPSGGNGPSPAGDWGIRWCNMFVAMPLLWQYEYFQDASFGRKVLFPLLSGIAEFWRCWLLRRPNSDGDGDYVYEDANDSITELGWWMGCAEERGPACSKWKDPIMAIAFVSARMYCT